LYEEFVIRIPKIETPCHKERFRNCEMITVNYIAGTQLRARLQTYGIDPDMMFPEDYMHHDDLLALIRHYYGLVFDDDKTCMCCYCGMPIERLQHRHLIFLSQYLQAVLAEDNREKE